MNCQLESTAQVCSFFPLGGFAATLGGSTGFIFGLLRSDTRLSTDVDVLGDEAVNNVLINSTIIILFSTQLTKGKFTMVNYYKIRLPNYARLILN